MMFDKRQTNLGKGIAVLLLLFHHLFFNNPDQYNSYVSLIWIGNVPLVCKIADLCKVCVYIFLLLSGYGLYKSYQIKNNSGGELKRGFLPLTVNRITKLLLPFMFIFILFVPIGFFFGRNPLHIYQGSFLNFILDFLGIAQVFATPTMNETWWYMSVILAFYLLFPLLYKWILKKHIFVWIMLFCSAALLLVPFYKILFLYYLKIYFFPFCFGICMAEFDLFERFRQKLQGKGKMVCISLLLVFLTGVLTYFKAVIFASFFAFAILLFSYSVFTKNGVLGRFLGFAGKHSGNIFMFHTFIYSYYFHDFIYWFQYPVLIFAVLFIVCMLISILLERIKNWIGFHKLYTVLSI